MEQVLNIYEKQSREWQQFSSVISNNLQEIDNNVQREEKKRLEIEDTIENVKILSRHAQAQAFVKICPRAYISATIKHTGEYNVEVNSEYQCTLTKDQTVEFLEEQLMEQNGILENYRIQKEQLEKRLSFNSEEDELPDTRNMPEKIVTEKGIAFKQGPLYEIVEIETDIPYVKNITRISRIKENHELLTKSITNLKLYNTNDKL